MGRKLRSILTMALSSLFCSVLSAATAHAAITWQANIADTYQHQRWGAPDGSGPAAAADVAPASISWEAEYTPAAAGPPAVLESVDFGGWCYPAAVNNIFYRYSTLGYATYGANNVNSVTKLHDELNTLQAAYFNDPAPGGVASWANILNARGAGTAKGVNVPGKIGGLVAGEFKQDGANLKYWSSDGRERKIVGTTIFDQLSGIMGLGDSSALKLNPKAGVVASPLNWWNYHVVTVAGFDDAAGSEAVYFADPDTNKGNGAAQAGWTAFFATGEDDWLADPAGVPAKVRRFNEGVDGIPVPAGAAPTGAEQASLYLSGTLNAGKTTFNAATGRYDGASIVGLHTFEHMRGANKGAGGGAGGVAKTFEFTPDAPIDMGISEFYLFPEAGDEIAAISGLTLPGWTGSLYSGVDPLDPSSPFLRTGWHFATSPGNAMFGSSVLAFDYSTLNPVAAAIDGFDIIYNSFLRDTVTGAPLSSPSLHVQVVGADMGFDDLEQQVPEPSGGMFVALVVLIGVRRRKSRRPLAS